jgi:hypothetical protein
MGPAFCTAEPLVREFQTCQFLLLCEARASIQKISVSKQQISVNPTEDREKAHGLLVVSRYILVLPMQKHHFLSVREYWRLAAPDPSSKPQLMKSRQKHTAHGKVQSFYTNHDFMVIPKTFTLHPKLPCTLDQSSSSLPPTYMHMITQEKGFKT